MVLAEKILRYPSSDCVVWLLVITPPQIYNEKEQAGQEKPKMQYEEKRSSREYSVGAKSSVHGDKKLKEKLDATQMKRNGALWESPHPAKIPICEQELKIKQ